MKPKISGILTFAIVFTVGMYLMVLALGSAVFWLFGLAPQLPTGTDGPDRALQIILISIPFLGLYLGSDYYEKGSKDLENINAIGANLRIALSYKLDCITAINDSRTVLSDHEVQLVKLASDARSKLTDSRANTDAILEGVKAVRSMTAWVEAHPQTQVSDHYRQTLSNVLSLETEIRRVREDYNSTVKKWNEGTMGLLGEFLSFCFSVHRLEYLS